MSLLLCVKCVYVCMVSSSGKALTVVPKNTNSMKQEIIIEEREKEILGEYVRRRTTTLRSLFVLYLVHNSAHCFGSLLLRREATVGVLVDVDGDLVSMSLALSA
jgi:hypothetical protein